MDTNTTTRCRCGFEGTGEHPCHGKAYTCRKPSRPRLVSLGPAALPGVQMKFSAYETHACDACWAEHTKKAG